MLDEKLVAAIKKNGKHPKAPVYFVDCRNQAAALANFMKGGGIESTHHYADSHIQFMGIENIHAMRESFRRIYELCRSTAMQGDGGYNTQWLSLLENTRWLEHVRVVLAAAKRCASVVHEQGSSLVVHCSDGWDRTAQVAALTEILLDPFYRTFRGFQILVEKEWCSFGFQFADRCGHSGRGVNFWEDENCSPIFVQFLDCIWQLMEQFPFAFEFNGNYLCALQSELYAARSGTFLQNSEFDRTKLNIQDRCFSVWFVLRNSVDAERYSNPFYMPATKAQVDTLGSQQQSIGGGGDGESSRSSSTVINSKVLVPDVHPSSIKFWSQCYFKHLMNSKVGANQETCAKDLLRAVQDIAREKEAVETQLRNAKQLLMAEHTTSLQAREEMDALREENSKLQAEVQKKQQEHRQRLSDSAEVLQEDEEDGDGVLLTHNPGTNKKASNVTACVACM
jgi:myotubularin-related protein 1/2